MDLVNEEKGSLGIAVALTTPRYSLGTSLSRPFFFQYHLLICLFLSVSIHLCASFLFLYFPFPFTVFFSLFYSIEYFGEG